MELQELKKTPDRLGSEVLSAVSVAPEGGRPAPGGAGQCLDPSAQVLQDAPQELEEADIELWFLPPYSPELNDIEHSFHRVKHQEMPICTYDTDRRLIQDLHVGFFHLRQDLVYSYNSMLYT